jgi:hypothetical protein
MFTVAALVAAFVVPGAYARPADHKPCPDSCVARVKHRVHHQHVEARHRREAREWRYYRAHPMPYCTWGPESGGNYRAMNPTSSAGGKYQMLNQTFHTYGGPFYGTGHDAAYAPPLVQERVARRVLRGQGLGAWANC